MRPTLARHFVAEAHNNAWANHRLLKACCQLTREAFAARRTSFFPSIKATLNHILDATITIPRTKGLVREPLHRLLAHVFQHDIHHRGQVHAMLAGTGVAPPQLDEFHCSDEADLRRADFAELGFDEAAIWGEGPAGR